MVPTRLLGAALVLLGCASSPRRERPPSGCAPQDAHAEGDCDLVLSGIAWDGSRCEPLSSGCRCAGADCDAVHPDEASCLAAHRHCPGAAPAASEPPPADVCAPQDARAVGDCDMIIDLVRWDGKQCVPLYSGCGCEGADCGEIYGDEAECAKAHEHCPK